MALSGMVRPSKQDLTYDKRKPSRGCGRQSIDLWDARQFYGSVVSLHVPKQRLPINHTRQVRTVRCRRIESPQGIIRDIVESLSLDLTRNHLLRMEVSRTKPPIAQSLG